MNRLQIAIQKKGRLSEKSLELLKKCGIQVSLGDRKLKAIAKNFDAELLFLRDDDIPQYVEQGVADIGILGLNEVLEKEKSIDIVKHLNFAGCRMSLAIPREVDYQGVQYFNGKTIATSYPNILKTYCKENQLEITIEEIGGSVEIATGIGLADGIFDIVSTGSTLIMNGLQEVETVLKSEAVLVSNQNLSETKQKLLNQLLFRIDATNKGDEYRYILLNAPNDSIPQIVDLLPGMRSPTILPLAESGWSSVHSVVAETEFWQVIEQLKENGAQGILIIPIEKMVL